MALGRRGMESGTVRGCVLTCIGNPARLHQDFRYRRHGTSRRNIMYATRGSALILLLPSSLNPMVSIIPYIPLLRLRNNPHTTSRALLTSAVPTWEMRPTCIDAAAAHTARARTSSEQTHIRAQLLRRRWRPRWRSRPRSRHRCRKCLWTSLHASRPALYHLR
jgi:hypothetical protein